MLFCSMLCSRLEFHRAAAASPHGCSAHRFCCGSRAVCEYREYRSHVRNRHRAATASAPNARRRPRNFQYPDSRAYRAYHAYRENPELHRVTPAACGDKPSFLRRSPLEQPGAGRASHCGAPRSMKP